MMMAPPVPFAQRYALISHCQDASLLHKADAMIAVDFRAQGLLALPGATVTTDVQTRVRDGALRLKQVLWTVQVPTRSDPGLEARTLCLSPENAFWYDLHEDTALNFGGDLSQTGTRILRYVPGRRATVLMPDEPVRTIRKFKKKERLAAAIERHRMIEKATQGKDIHIPRLLSKGPDYCLSLCPGVPMETGLATADRLRSLGAMIARLHSCDAAEMPKADVPDAALIWLQAAIPGLAPRLQKIKDAVPDDEGQPSVLCHGDLSLAQVLVDCAEDGDRLTLLDFDRAGAGGAGRDLATLLCGLRDTGIDPALKAEDLVIEEYSRHADLPANFWHARGMAELERLRHLIRKGAAPTRAIIAGLERAEATLIR